MIVGIGTDLANIERIENILHRYGDKFRKRIFTTKEQKKAIERSDEAATLAKRWAAKEACAKALGTGLRMGISWQDMSIDNLSLGQPTMTLTGWAKTRLERITPTGYCAKVHISVTNDWPWAHAIVLIDVQPG